MSEFDLFRVMIGVPHSPCLTSQELINRFIKEQTKFIDMQGDDEWWKYYVEAVSNLKNIY